MYKLSDVIRIAGCFIGARLRFRFLRGRALLAYQNIRAQKVLRFAARRSSFHAERLQAVEDLNQWRHLPPIEKHDMMSNFESYNTVNIPLEPAMKVALAAEESRVFTEKFAGFTVGLSSGTSGHRGIFLVSGLEQLRWAGAILSRTLPAIRVRGWKVAMFMRSNSNLYETLGSRWLRFQCFDLLTPLQESVEQLNQFQPDVLVGPASLLSLLRNEKLARRLRIEPIRVISVAEVLEPQDKESLEKAFGVPVHQIYQCTEGLIAACCDRGSLHLLEDVMAVDLEVLSEDADSLRAVPVITDLWRTTQPIIRYRMNDVIVLEKKACACGSGFRVLRAIEGRCDDVLYACNVKGELAPVFADLIRRIMLFSADNIADYQVMQHTLSAWDVYVNLDRSSDLRMLAESLEQRFQQTLATYGLVAPRINVMQGVPPMARMAKKRRVQRTFPIDAMDKMRVMIA
jgi:putative adenylate-forming enzyme